MRAQLTIDALPVLMEGGISNYVFPLVQEICALFEESFEVLLLFRLGPYPDRWRRYRKYLKKRQHFGERVTRTFLPDRFERFLWKRQIIAAGSKKKRKKIFLATTEMVPSAKDQTVGSIFYDLTPVRLSEFFPGSSARFLTDASAQASRSNFIIAISQSTKNDVVEILGYPEDRVCVVYPGAPPPLHFFTGAYRKINRPYIIYMGSLALNKNVDGMLRIFSRCVHEHQLDIDIILIGKDFCGSSFWNEMASELRIVDRVRLLGWVSEKQRNKLLIGSEMLWLFSWYEGFGLPVLEAAANGIPAMVSNRGSLPEILCNPEQEIDPSCEKEAAEKISVALQNPSVLQRWRSNGFDRAESFSWFESARRLLDFMEMQIR